MTDDEYVEFIKGATAEIQSLQTEQARLSDAIEVCIEHHRQLSAESKAVSVYLQTNHANMMDATLQMLCEANGIPYTSQQQTVVMPEEKQTH